MNAILICPSDRPHVGWLAENEPLCAVPIAGQSLLEYWLATLAAEGVRHVIIAVDDRVEAIQQAAREGLPWGLTVEVHRQDVELTPAQALLEFYKTLGSSPANKNIAVLDHFPGLAQFPMFVSYAGWFAAVRAWLPRARTADRVGVKEIAPNVWTGLRSRISGKATLRAPCWIEEEVVIGDRAVLGPNTIVERGSFIDSDARVISSYVGPDTYVGRFSDVQKCIARGNTLINWQSASAIQVPDRFVLSSLRQHHEQTPGLLARLGIQSRFNSWLARARH